MKSKKKNNTQNSVDKLLSDLRERIKELEALHNTSRLLQVQDLPLDFLMTDIIASLPRAWQYSESTVARIRYGQKKYSSPKFRLTRWKQEEKFKTKGGNKGSIEICYLKEKPQEHEGPFLKEERDLINSLAEMLKSFFERMEAENALKSAYNHLERMVDERTTELEELNRALKSEIEERKSDEHKIRQYQQQLRELASELSLAEERERKAIAAELHDNIAQSLAMIKLKLMESKGETHTQVHKKRADDIRRMLDQVIYHTRSLTFEISPPVLYELGLVPAIEWLGEQFHEKHGLRVEINSEVGKLTLSDEVQFVLFKTVRELLVNAAKHSKAKRIWIKIKLAKEKIKITVKDNGIGFNPAKLKTASIRGSGFGLISIRERLKCLEGMLNVRSSPGKGTSVEVEVNLNGNQGKKYEHKNTDRR